ncbi:hypothetical protein Afil01_03400 [Actinorhabdospora filicis]|uniref:NB-ARC domain-containing protein n=1 Tax=Actinorhabdospora filicis TaxID=1785913 RepID=A0A9W6W724_9ACTN|nr:tetratricopeptide repeat protein [Actinorhabdospora filicis]GLZ75533.1 hypothetical protein Afil01_03400 [Actinorhabdospora filicis]
MRKPQELPAAPRIFFNRDDEARELDVLSAPADGRTVPRLILVTGMPGSGKTAVAVLAALRASEAFTEGVLYVDLGELRRRGIADLGDVLLGFLRSLGVAREEIPDDEAARARLFRSVTSHKAILVFVDNAVDRREIDRLMPSSPRSAMVVTSFRRPEELDPLADVRLSLSGLGNGHARQVLAAYCDPARLDAEPEATAALLHAASGVPLALHLIGGRLARSTASPAQVLAELHAKGRDAMLEDIAEIAYAGLTEETRRAYRLLAAHPGPGFDVADVAALTGATGTAARGAVEELRGSHLVSGGEDGRYNMGELIRAHARVLAAGEDLDSAQTRLIGDLLTRASFADLAMGERLRVIEPAKGTGPFGDRAEAMTWMERRRALLVTVQRRAFRSGFMREVCGFTEAMWPLFMDRRNELDWYESSDLGVRAAPSLGPDVEARMLTLASRWDMEHGELADAVSKLEGAIGLARRADVLASAWEFLGRALVRRGEYERAVTAHETAYGIDEGNRARGLQKQFTGQAYAALGDHARAVAALREARARFTAHPRDLGKVLMDLARLAGDDEARELFAAAAAVLEAEGAAYYQAEALAELGTRFGDDGALERARAIYAGMGSSRAAALAGQARAELASADQHDLR